MIFALHDMTYIVEPTSEDFVWDVLADDGQLYQSTGPDEETAMLRLSDRLATTDSEW